MWNLIVNPINSLADTTASPINTDAIPLLNLGPVQLHDAIPLMNLGPVQLHDDKPLSIIGADLASLGPKYNQDATKTSTPVSAADSVPAMTIAPAKLSDQHMLGADSASLGPNYSHLDQHMLGADSASLGPKYSQPEQHMLGTDSASRGPTYMLGTDSASRGPKHSHLDQHKQKGHKHQSKKHSHDHAGDMLDQLSAEEYDYVIEEFLNFLESKHGREIVEREALSREPTAERHGTRELEDSSHSAQSIWSMLTGERDRKAAEQVDQMSNHSAHGIWSFLIGERDQKAAEQVDQMSNHSAQSATLLGDDTASLGPQIAMPGSDKASWTPTYLSDDQMLGSDTASLGPQAAMPGSDKASWSPTYEHRMHSLMPAMNMNDEGGRLYSTQNHSDYDASYDSDDIPMMLQYLSEFDHQTTDPDHPASEPMLAMTPAKANRHYHASLPANEMTSLTPATYTDASSQTAHDDAPEFTDEELEQLFSLYLQSMMEPRAESQNAKAAPVKPSLRGSQSEYTRPVKYYDDSTWVY